MKITTSPIKYNVIAPQNRNRLNNKPVAFNGLSSSFSKATNGLYDSLANGLINISKNSGVKKFVNKLANSKLSYTHLLTAESIILTGFYMQNTARNKKIKKEQKFPMMLNDAMVTALSAFLNYTMDGKISTRISQLQDTVKSPQRKKIVKDLIDNAGNIFSGEELEQVRGLVAGESIKKAGKEITADSLKNAKKSILYDITHGFENIGKNLTPKRTEQIANMVENIPSERIEKAVKQLSESDKVIAGIGLCKTMIIFTLIYRYIGPVIITPLANKISSAIQNRSKNKKAQTANQIKPEENKKS